MPAPSKLVRARFLDESEVNFLRYGLRLERDDVTIKRALQSLCNYYEGGRILRDSNEVRQLIHSHLSSEVILHRRWAMKALGLIGHSEDTHRLIDRLRVETDVEAQTWGIAALLGGTRARSLEQLVDEAGLEKSSALVLAARLYAPEEWIRMNAAGVRVSLKDDDLALKWAVFLIGYRKAPTDLFSPKYSNDVFLGELNTHDAEDIREYSVWALWERSDYDASNLKIDLSTARHQPENVRKWLYRLGAQSPKSAALDPDAFSELSRDPAASAREGLASGVADLDPSVYGSEVLNWYSRERSKSVRELLLSSVAAQSERSSDYQDLIRHRFEAEQADSPLRRRLLAASANTPLWPALKQIEGRDELVRQGLFAMSGQATFVLGDQIVTGPTFQAGRDIKANTLVVGDMINSANAAVQQMDTTDEGAQQTLTQVLEMLRATHVPDEKKAEVAAAVEAMAKEPSAENKQSLLQKLTSYGKNAMALGAAIGGLDKLIEAVQNLPI